MNVYGLWTVSFFTSEGEGKGTLTLGKGVLTGGDSNYYYFGSYAQDESQLTGLLKVVHYSGQLSNVFGPIRQFDLTFSAVAGNDLIMGQGQPTDPRIRLRLSIRMQRVLNLDA